MNLNSSFKTAQSEGESSLYGYLNFKSLQGSSEGPYMPGLLVGVSTTLMLFLMNTCDFSTGCSKVLQLRYQNAGSRSCPNPIKKHIFL